MMPDRKILLVGASQQGILLMRAFARTQAVALSVLDPHNVYIRDVVGVLAVQEQFRDSAAARAAPADAVVFGAPCEDQFTLARHFLAVDKPLLFSNPLGNRLEGLADLQKSIPGSCRLLTVSDPDRMHPTLRQLKEWVQSERLGPLRQVLAVAAGGEMAPSETLARLVSVGQWFAGRIERVVADSGRDPGDRLPAGGLSVLARHEGQVRANYLVQPGPKIREWELSLCCERGTIRFQSQRSGWSWRGNSDSNWTLEAGQHLTEDELYARQAAAFLKALDETGGQTEVGCGFRNGVETMRTHLAVCSAAQMRHWVDVRPQPRPEIRASGG